VANLTPAQVRAWQPGGLDGSREGSRLAMEDSRTVLDELGLADSGQQMGQRWAVGCIALEITQRCNLDCTACYLSEHSEAVRDLPLEAVFRRIDVISAHCGTNTDVQITGGDSTLRKQPELVAIVAKVVERGLRPTLMTNGINASAHLLRELADAGLVDVAFHVDTTQERKGCRSEASLNALRSEYLQTAASQGLSVMFNTTVHAGNLHEVPELVRFFKANADRVRTASFQLQADTGRGVDRTTGSGVNRRTAIEAMELGLGATVGFGVPHVGHPECTAYAIGAVAGERYFNVFNHPSLVQAVQHATREVVFTRGDHFERLPRWSSQSLRNSSCFFGDWVG
jgi:7,8-dihydro-6-hydroxymethylpterin dimethyltransferase